MNAHSYIQRTKEFFNGQRFDLPSNPKHLAVIVETREIADFGAIVKNHLHFLPKDFGLLVVHSKANEQFVQEQLAGVDNYTTMTLPFPTMNTKQYNDLLTSYNFWRVIEAEGVLIFQTDSLLLRKGIEQFFEYDYVGAPWSHINITGGNGGLSIRSVSEMKRISKDFKYDNSRDGNEDIFFCCKVNNCAPNNIAQQFSVETIFYPKPIGIHACDKYLQPALTSMIFERALNEMKESVLDNLKQHKDVAHNRSK